MGVLRQTGDMSISAAAILREHFRSLHGLSLGADPLSEILSVVRGSAPPELDFAFEVRGPDRAGELKSVMVTRSEIRAAVRSAGS